jgi:uncharacterized RDD family membrane protein YckC
MCYAVLLFFITYTTHKITNTPLEPQDPIKGNIISFFSLTLPVFLYFFFYESSRKKGTIGKQLQKIEVGNNSKKNVFVRVLFKIAPWEMAHFGIHWSVYYSTNNMEIPTWNLIVSIFPNIIVIGYFISIVITKGKSSIYDRIAHTSILRKPII